MMPALGFGTPHPSTHEMGSFTKPPIPSIIDPPRGLEVHCIYRHISPIPYSCTARSTTEDILYDSLSDYLPQPQHLAQPSRHRQLLLHPFTKDCQNVEEEPYQGEEGEEQYQGDIGERQRIRMRRGMIRQMISKLRIL